MRPKAKETYTVQKVKRLARPLPGVIEAAISGRWRLSNWPSCLRHAGYSQRGSFSESSPC